MNYPFTTKWIGGAALLGGLLVCGNSGLAANYLGDDHDELVVGAPGEAPGPDPKSGLVFVYRGSGPRVIASATIDQAGLGANEAGDQFGAAFAIGDFDGDGEDDLAIGAPREAPGPSPASGAVFVYRGTGAGLAPDEVLDQQGLGSNELGDRFGAALAAGDFDGDGYDDLIVAAPNEAPGPSPASGGLFLFRGSSLGLTPGRFIDQTGLGSNEADDQFGAALAVGDYDGDGYDDLAVGAPGEAPGSDPKSGLVFVFNGSSNSLVAGRILGQAGLGSNESDDRFGFALASGDFDDDGRDDLAVGAPGESPGSDPKSGGVFTFRGTDDGLVAWKFVDQAGLGSNEAGDLFGFALSSGDYDGDGNDDLAVGAPGESPGGDPQSGGVFVFEGDSGGLEPLQFLDQAGLGSNEAGDRFGAALSSGNYVGNSRDDLAVGAPGESPGGDPQSGGVFLFRGVGAGLTAQQFVDQAGLGANEAGDRFGQALADG